MNEIYEHRAVGKKAVLHNGYPANGEIYDTVLKLAREAIDFLLTCDQLDGREEFTTEMLCGKEQWELWTDLEKQTAGRCLVSMAITKTLPLEIIECIGRKHISPARFRIKR